MSGSLPVREFGYPVGHRYYVQGYGAPAAGYLRQDHPRRKYGNVKTHGRRNSHSSVRENGDDLTMATAMISEHIPDLDLHHSVHRASELPFSLRVSPWTKFFMLILIVLMITLTRSLVILATLYGLILLVYWLAGLPVKKLFQWYTMPVIFVVTLVGILAWTEPGTAVLTVPLPGLHPHPDRQRDPAGRNPAPESPDIHQFLALLPHDHPLRVLLRDDLPPLSRTPRPDLPHGVPLPVPDSRDDRVHAQGGPVPGRGLHPFNPGSGEALRRSCRPRLHQVVRAGGACA